MNSLITYDVSGRQPEVKAAMLAKGYFDYWTANNQTYYLPNTTLWKQNATPQVALADMQQVIQTLNQYQPVNNQIRLERCAAVEWSNWAAILGDARR